MYKKTNIFNGNNYIVHSVVFLSNIDSTLRKRFLRNNGLVPIKRVDKKLSGTGKIQYRYRIREPSLFSSFFTKKINSKIYGEINIIFGIY